MLVLVAAVAAAAYGATSASSKNQKATGTAAVSGSVTFDGIWTGSEADRLRAGHQGLQQGLSERQDQLQAARQQPDDRAGDGDHRRQSARHGRHRPAGLREPAGAAREAEADHLREGRDLAELRAVVAVDRNVQQQALRARLQGVEQVALLVQRARFQGGGSEGAEDVRAAADDGEDAPRVGHAGVLDRRLRRLDADGHVREHLPAHVRPGEVRPAGRAQDQVDRPVGDHRAEDDGQDPRRHVEHRGRHQRRAPVRLQRLRHERVRLPRPRRRSCSRPTSSRA